MASRKSGKTPPTLDEKDTDDLEAAFLEKLDGYEPTARVSEKFARSGEDAEREQTDRPKESTQEDGYGQFREALEAVEFPATTDEDSGSLDAQSSVEEPDSEQQRKLTHKEMMAEAFDSIDSGSAVHAGKFRGRGYNVGEDVQIVDDLSLKEEVGENSTSRDSGDPDDDDMLFFEAMAADDVRPVVGQRVEPQHGRRAIPDGARWRSVSELRALSEKDLLEPTLTREQRERLKRSRKRPMPVINIRQSRRQEALSEVRTFVNGAGRRGIPYIRIITGKGRQSKGLPVLKRAVIEWVEQDGGQRVIGWAPETDRSGNYGSVVMELRVVRDDD